MDLARQAARIGALADDTRRALFDYVVAQPEPVSREQAAAALGMAIHTAAFHLDKLVKKGLLDVEYRRLSGRTGPGAGRPSKLYRRAEEEVSVSLPQRQYDIVGDILATAVTRATAGESLEDAVRLSAHEAGAAIGSAPSAPDESGDAPAHHTLEDVTAKLADCGYQPREVDGEIALTNCPFHALAHDHTDLVCGLNVSFVQGVADAMGADDVVARLEPTPGWCCVRLRKD